MRNGYRMEIINFLISCSYVVSESLETSCFFVNLDSFVSYQKILSSHVIDFHSRLFNASDSVLVDDFSIINHVIPFVVSDHDNLQFNSYSRFH